MQCSAHEASDGRHVCSAAGHQAIKYTELLASCDLPASRTYSELSLVSNTLAECGVECRKTVSQTAQAFQCNE